MSLNATLEISRNTLLNTQQLIQTGNNNISNADNKAYARQSGVVSSNVAVRRGAAYLGMGASLDQIIQNRESFIERQLLNGRSQESQYTTLNDRLSQVGAYFSDDGETGITNLAGKFWSAWESLTKNNGESEKTGVYQAALNLASGINQIHESLDDSAVSLKEEISDNVDKINGLLEKIYNYNEKIAKSEMPGATANDLRDQRYKALSELSELISVNYSEDDNGIMTVSTGTSTNLVSGSPPVLHQLRYNPDSDGDTFTITLDSESGKKLAEFKDTAPYAAVTGDHEVRYGVEFSGKVKGLLQSLNNVTEYSARLDTFKDALIDWTNVTYNKGLTTTQNIFSTSATDYISVDSTLTASGIASSQALRMANLQDAEIPALGDVTFSSYLSTIQEQLGLDQSDATSQAEFKAAYLETMEAQQQAVSGVSIDEETVNLIKYQQIYQAAAKVVQTTKDLMETTIQMV